MADNEPTALQQTIRRAISQSGKSREHFDRLIQQRTGTKGKPLFDIDRGKSKSPSLETLRVIADAFELPVSHFASGVGSATLRPDQQRIVGASDGDGAIAIRQVDLSYSMGPGTNIEDYPEEAAVQFDPNLLRLLTRTPPDRLFVATGAGESMQPTLLDNDTVLIDMNQRVLNMMDRIWAVSVHGSGAIKRLRAIGKDRVLVISDNPAVPPQEVLADDLHIVGRVIWVGRRV